MSVVLKKLEFSNMFSYGENNSITLNDNRITQLSAPNGTGKTSISLILQELLYNKNVKKLNKSDILNKYSEAKQWTGKVFFNVGAKEYELTVTRKNNSSTVTLLEDGTDISEHKILDTYKKIHSIIGRDFEVFSQLTYQSSTNLLEFLKATDANRKKFLISLFNLEKYLVIGDKIKLVLGETDKKLIEKNAELKTVQSFLNRNALPEKETEIEVPQIDETLKPKIEVLELEIAEQLTTYRKIDKNNNLVKERDGLVFDMASKIPELEDGTLEKLEATKKQINILSSKLQDVSKQLRSLDTSDVCYACKQPIDNSQSKALSDALESEKTSFEQELEIKREDLKQLAGIRDEHSKAKQQYEKNLKAQERFTQLSQLIDTSLPQEYPDYKKLNDELKVLKQELEVQTDRHQKAIQYNQSVKIRNAKIDGLVEQIVDFKARQQLLENDILKIQDKANNLAILKKAFSTSGIVAYKLENVAKQLEESINHYLAVLSDGQFQVIFRLSGEKLNIVVVNNGEEVSIDSLSGGEFSRVQTSVLLAVRNTLSTIGGNSINLLFLDEIMAVLDDTGKERLFEVLQEEKELNVFLVSHEYSHPLIPRIEITKKDNISYIDS
jgi:DNA repair exonuclease SbcCD ATPase subunit